jgi:hypothetical protein
MPPASLYRHAYLIFYSDPLQPIAKSLGKASLVTNRCHEPSSRWRRKRAFARLRRSRAVIQQLSEVQVESFRGHPRESHVYFHCRPCSVSPSVYVYRRIRFLPRSPHFKINHLRRTRAFHQSSPRARCWIAAHLFSCICETLTQVKMLLRLLREEKGVGCFRTVLPVFASG